MKISNVGFKQRSLRLKNYKNQHQEAYKRNENHSYESLHKHFGHIRFIYAK